MKARDYQEWGVSALWEYFKAHTGNPVIAMPTGTGKSHIIADAVKQALNWYITTRVLMLTHSKELIDQNYKKLLAVWPNAPAGIFSAGLGVKQTQFPITYAGILSVSGNEHLFGHIDIVFIDECDLVSDEEKTVYRKVLAALKVANPKIKFVGLTATPWRHGVGMITDGDNPLFTHIAVDMIKPEVFNWFFDQGYLCRLVAKPTATQFDISEVKVRGDDFIAGQLERAVNKDDITEAAIREAREVAVGRRKWLVFCAGVQHAISTTDIINMLGIEARVVHSKQKASTKKQQGERDENIEWFRNYKGEGPIALVNNDILTVGFDDPDIDLIIILRPTMSSRLWVQMLGRGTRPVFAEGFDLSTAEGRLLAILHSHKPNCMVLDYAKNVPRLGPINDPVIPRKKGKGGPQPAPVKLCTNPLKETGNPCNTYNHASRRTCEVCGAEFPETIKIGFEAGEHAVTKATEFPIVEAFTVEHVTYTVHKRLGPQPMLKVRYHCGIRAFDEYVCIQHPAGNYARKKAMDWWRETYTGEGSVPETVDAALDLARGLRAPTHIDVHLNTKYPTVLRKCYDGSKFGTQEPQVKTPVVDITDERVHTVVTQEAEPDYQAQWNQRTALATEEHDPYGTDDIPF